MNFTPIDFNNWNRREIFYYFSSIAPTSYSLTFEINVTKLKRLMDYKKLKFFPAYLYVVTKSLNKQIEFKVAKENGVLGYFDTLTPLYATFHDDDKTFSLMWSEYSDDFFTFYQSYISNQNKYGKVHGILSNGIPPKNAYTVSSIPWVEFNHFAVHSFDNKDYFFPSIEAGKIINRNEELIMPLSMTCHHATTDGYHIKCFIDTLKYEMDELSKKIVGI